MPNGFAGEMAWGYAGPDGSQHLNHPVEKE